MNHIYQIIPSRSGERGEGLSAEEESEQESERCEHVLKLCEIDGYDETANKKKKSCVVLSNVSKKRVPLRVPRM
jgi:hypothetical protein